MKTKFKAIVAMDKNRLIGDGANIPWFLSEDFKHFKRTTLNHSILMGRKTFDSIGKPLPKRDNYVLTRNSRWKSEGVYSIPHISWLKAEETVFVIGGAEIYKLLDEYIDEWIISEIKGDFKGDTHLHEFEKDFGERSYLRQESDFDIYTIKRK